MPEIPLRAHDLPEIHQLVGFFRNRQSCPQGFGKMVIFSDSDGGQAVLFAVEASIMISSRSYKHFQCSEMTHEFEKNQFLSKPV
jgi:hypothetical protein